MSSTIPATKYESKGSLTFISPKELLDCAGNTIHLEYGESKHSTYPLNFNWSEDPQSIHKAILFCIHHHTIQYYETNTDSKPTKPHLKLIPLTDHTPEDIQAEEKCILELVTYCNTRMHERVKLIEPATEALPFQYNNLSDLKIFAPYKFKPESLPTLLTDTGLLTLRLHNGWSTLKETSPRYGFYLQFGAYKFKSHLPKSALPKRVRAASLVVNEPQDSKKNIPPVENI